MILLAGDYNALELTHEFMTKNIRPGGFCIDATAGRGKDTSFLCGLVGTTGKVIALDIQKEAVESTNALLIECGYAEIGQAVLDSHENIANYAKEGDVDCIAFNFGWLPGGDHSVFTCPQISIAAIKQGLKLLRVGGL